MRLHLLFSYALLATAIARADVRAQSTIPATIGERVRLTTVTERGRHRAVGRVIAIGVDSLTLDTDATGPARVAISTVTGVETSAGRQTNGGRGMVYGLLAGSLVGAIIGVRMSQAQAVSCRTDRGNSVCLSSGGPQVVSHYGGAA